MAKKYLKGFEKPHLEHDIKIKSHLVKAKKEILSALQVISDNKRRDTQFRLASRTTEIGLIGLLNLIENIPFTKELPKAEVKTSKELRQIRKDKRKGGNLRGKGVRNVRRR